MDRLAELADRPPLKGEALRPRNGLLTDADRAQPKLGVSLEVIRRGAVHDDVPAARSGLGEEAREHGRPAPDRPDGIAGHDCGASENSVREDPARRECERLVRAGDERRNRVFAVTIHEVLRGGELECGRERQLWRHGHGRERRDPGPPAVASERRQRDEHHARVGGRDQRGVDGGQREERDGDGDDRGRDRDRVADGASPDIDASEHPGVTLLLVSETAP